MKTGALTGFQRFSPLCAGLSADGEHPRERITLADSRPHPLLPVRGAVSLLGCNEDRVLDLVESGELAWCWNLALIPESHSKELRILLASVLAFNDATECNLGFREAWGLMFPSCRENGYLTASTLSLAFNVSSSHIYALIKRGQLIAAPWSRGVKGSAKISVPSVVEFLHGRRYPVPDF
jgi:hypothetical protein